MPKTKIKDADKYWEVREKAYKDFFGVAWQDFIDDWMCENKTPQEVVDSCWDRIDYCKNCETYYWINSDHGVYYCPYCHALGDGSEPDYAAEKEAYEEHLWETRNER